MPPLDMLVTYINTGGEEVVSVKTRQPVVIERQ